MKSPMTTSEELKPCPCGSDFLSHWEDMKGHSHFVECTVCGHSGPRGSTPDEARRLWNELAGLAPAEKPEPQEKPEPIARLGATRLPFGQYNGRTFDDTPRDYLDWLCREQETFYESLRAYLRHPELESHRGEYDDEPDDHDHLPDRLREVSRQFHALAYNLAVTIDPGPERTVALRKLLEAKDAAVRAKLHPGG